MNLTETKNQLIARYIGGLKLVIQDRLALQEVWTMIDAINLVMKVESQINRSMVRTQGNFRRSTQEAYSAPKGTTTSGSNDNSNKDAPSTQNSTQNRSETSAPIRSNTQGRNQQQQQINNDPYARPNLGKCFWCNQPDHLSNNCPNRRSVNFVEEGGNEVEHVLKEDIYEGAKFVEGDLGEEMVCIVQQLCLPQKSWTTLNDIKYFGLYALFVIKCAT